ncbi:unnamed protein product [Polarella glacialis]|uniref:Uncharacterized protein n=1 Tax=Polarella glacialis TaxID=89957 RepID=A0A813DT85_POLGL|nr:unnamed protein product [Polarella glacialis]
MDAITLKEATDNMLSFAKLLWDTGSWSGCILILTFSTIIPVMKIVLLVLGGIWRHSKDERKVTWARRMISCVQVISKWACPDMFAYILMLYLIRSLNHPPTLNGLMILDVGFTCFSVFCLGSTISSLGVRRPPPTADSYDHEAKIPYVGFITSGLFVAFAVLMGIGCSMACMTLRLDIDTLYANGTIDATMKPFVDQLNLPALAHSNVSIWACCIDLLKMMKSAEANSFFAFVMLAIFVLFATVAHMVVLLILAFKVQLRRDEVSSLRRWEEVSAALRKVSMLDVFLVGVLIVVTSGSIYAKQGVVLGFGPGIWILFGAEACHYATYYLVALAVANRTKDGLPKGRATEDVDSDASEETTEDEEGAI